MIDFDERVTFWLQRVQSLPFACAYVALFARRLACAANARTRQCPLRVEAKKLLSRRRQSEYSYPCTWQFMLTCVLLSILGIGLSTKIAGIIYIHQVSGIKSMLYMREGVMSVNKDLVEVTSISQLTIGLKSWQYTAWMIWCWSNSTCYDSCLIKLGIQILPISWPHGEDTDFEWIMWCWILVSHKCN